MITLCPAAAEAAAAARCHCGWLQKVTGWKVMTAGGAAGADGRMCLDIWHPAICTDNDWSTLVSKLQANCSRDNDNLARVKRLETVYCSTTRSSADYRRHMQMTRCCRSCRNAHNETCSISQKVVATVLPLWPTPTHSGRGWPLAAVCWHNPMCKPSELPNRCICIWRRRQKSFFFVFFCPRSIAAHFPFEQIEQQICCWATSLFP